MKTVRLPARWQALTLAVLILIAASALHLHHLNTESIWHDEAWSIRAFRGPFTTPDDNTPYLYYLSGHVLWRAGAGETPLALRYVSVLFGLLTVAAALRISRHWMGVSGAAILGMMVAASPLLWEYAQEVRAYVVVPLIALSMVAVAERILRYKNGQSVRRMVWIMAFGVQVIGLYSHNLSVPLVVWLNVVLGTPWLLRRDWRKMLSWSAVEIAVIASYIPWLLTQSPSGTPLNSPPQPGFDLIRDIWLAYFFPVPAQVVDVQSNTMLMLIAALLGVVVSVAVVVWLIRFIMTRNQITVRGWILASHAALVPAFSTALMMAATIDYHPRYYIAAVPGTLMLIVYSIWAMRPQTLKKIGLLLATICTLILSAAGINQVLTTRTYQHDDFAALADYYATLPEDAVILVPFDVERALQDYFVQRVDIQAPFLNVPLYSDEATALEAINALVREEPRHVELLTWFQLPADVRGMYPCLLAAGSADVQPPQTFFGLSTHAFYLTQPVSMQPIEQDIRFSGINYEEATWGSSTGGTCLRTRWSLDTKTNTDYRVAAAVLNPFGGEISRIDAVIARDDNAETSDWSSDDSGSAYALLMLPPNVPSQPYDMIVSVYSSEQPSGLDVLDASGAPAGKSAHLENMILAGGVTELVEGGSRLVESSVSPDTTIETGNSLDITLLITEPATEVVLSGNGWTVSQLLENGTYPILSWHRFSIPAGSGDEAILTINGDQIASWPVVDVPRVFERPEADVTIDVDFPGAGTLVGANLPEAIKSDESPEIALIWQAAEPINQTPYTVFVQLISPDGIVIAQSDSQPASGDRPTVSWVVDEYIVDTHTLRFNIDDYQGEARLIAGLYDAAGGFVRLLTDDGLDHVMITEAISVRP